MQSHGASRRFHVSQRGLRIEALAGLTSTATRAAPGTSSRRSSSRFALNSTLKKLMPVRLPPGRARLATRPSLTGSSVTLKDDGDRRGCRLGRERAGGTAGRGDHGHLTANQIGRQRRQSIQLIVGPAVFDRYVLALDDSRSPSGPGGIRAHDPRTRQAMRGGGTRSPASPAAARAPRAATRRRAAEQRDELAPSCMSRKEHCEGRRGSKS